MQDQLHNKCQNGWIILQQLVMPISNILIIRYRQGRGIFFWRLFQIKNILPITVFCSAVKIFRYFYFIFIAVIYECSIENFWNQLPTLKYSYWVSKEEFQVLFLKSFQSMNVHEFTKKVYVGEKVGDIPSWWCVSKVGYMLWKLGIPT